MAAAEGHDEAIRVLLAYELCDVDARNQLGVTPLAFAASNGHKEVVQLLMERRDVNLDSRDNYG